MELTFPFKNLAVNTLLDFLSRDKYDDFVLIKKDEYPYVENYFEQAVEHLHGFIDSYENEIKQILHTTSQNTIDTYFSLLSDDLETIIERKKRDNFTVELKAWNQGSMDIAVS